jgi:hypothetical protein
MSQSATRRWSNVGTWSAWLVERRSWHANVRPTLGQREQPNRWVDMVGPMLARRMIFDGEMWSRLANVGIWPLTNRRPRVVGPASVLGRTLTYSIVCRFDFFFINTFIWYTSMGNSLFAFECFVYLRNNTFCIYTDFFPMFFFHYHVNFCSFGRYLAVISFAIALVYILEVWGSFYWWEI